MQIGRVIWDLKELQFYFALEEGHFNLYFTSMIISEKCSLNHVSFYFCRKNMPLHVKYILQIYFVTTSSCIWNEILRREKGKLKCAKKVQMSVVRLRDSWHIFPKGRNLMTALRPDRTFHSNFSKSLAFFAMFWSLSMFNNLETILLFWLLTTPNLQLIFLAKKMKFPTSNSSTAVGSNSAQLPVDSSSTGNAISPPTTASASSTAVPHSSETHNSNKKSENEPAQNMAANFTSTAGNFFRRYTSTSGHSANAQEMTTLNIKVVSLDQTSSTFNLTFQSCDSRSEITMQ